MNGVYSPPGDYIYFKSQVPLHKIPIGTKQWRYYDFGPKAVPPLICLPGTEGIADVCYKQIMSLSMKIHIYGTALGGFLAQLFAQHRPTRVRSLILSNTFLDTRNFSAAMPWAPVISWTPSFLLKRYVLTGILDGPHEPFIADSVDFVVSQVEMLSREDLAPRLTLTADAALVGLLLLTDSFITIMDTNDYSEIPQQLKDEVSERYLNARRAQLKTGGDFPFLSRPDEVNFHLQLHLRRVGVEPRPDLVPGISMGGGGGSSSEESEKKDPEDPPDDDKGSLDNPFAETQLPPAPESSESHSSEDQLISNAKFCHFGNGDTTLKNQHTITTEFVIRLGRGMFAVHLLSFYMASLYISLNCNLKLRPVV
ncbi:hypothetical protein ACFX13_038642 [Malus domestica]